MIPSQQTLREEEHRHAITEILFFASIGDVARMKALADKFAVCVRADFPEKTRPFTFCPQSCRCSFA